MSPTDKILTAIANYELANEMSQNVKGMESFAAYYRKKGSPADLRLMGRYEKTKKRVRAEFVKSLETEKRG